MVGTCSMSSSWRAEGWEYDEYPPSDSKLLAELIMLEGSRNGEGSVEGEAQHFDLY